MTVEQQPVFIDSVHQLGPEQFLDYFMTRKSAAIPDLPDPRAEDLTIAQRTLNNEFTICNETHRLPPNFSWKTNPSRDA